MLAERRAAAHEKRARGRASMKNAAGAPRRSRIGAAGGYGFVTWYMSAPPE